MRPGNTPGRQNTVLEWRAVAAIGCAVAMRWLVHRATKARKTCFTARTRWGAGVTSFAAMAITAIITTLPTITAGFLAGLVLTRAALTGAFVYTGSAPRPAGLSGLFARFETLPDKRHSLDQAVFHDRMLCEAGAPCATGLQAHRAAIPLIRADLSLIIPDSAKRRRR